MNCHKQANWYTTGESCTACHASGNTAGAVDPLVTNGLSGYGKHLVHVRNNGIYCEKCHGDGAYCYPRTNFNEAYAVSNINSGAHPESSGQRGIVNNISAPMDNSSLESGAVYIIRE
jgi:hypothetical protein